MPLFTNENGMSIYYEVTQSFNAQAHICVLIGGLTRDHTIWRKAIPELQKTYRIITLDNRDSGQSCKSYETYDIAAMAEDVANLLKHLNTPPVYLVGHSMGGFMAMHIAAKHPELVSTLALCSTSGVQVGSAKRYLQDRIIQIESQGAKATTASEIDIRATLPKLYAPTSLSDLEFVEEIVKHETSNPYPQSAESFKRQAIACRDHDARILLKDIHCPTLILTGKLDPYYTPELAINLASQLPNAEVNIIDNAAHMIQIEQPLDFCQSLNNFFSKIEHKQTKICQA